MPAAANPRRRSAIVAALTLVCLVLVPQIALAAVTISRAELNGSQLRIEGRAAPSKPITVDGVQMGTSDSGGNFRIERSGFAKPADCTVDVSDGVSTATARLSGCTVTAPPPSPPPSTPPPPPPSSPPPSTPPPPPPSTPPPTNTFHITTTSPLPNATVGDRYAGFIETCCQSGTPVRWSLTGGRVPAGLSFAGDSLRLTQTTGVTGTPTTEQTTTFTVQARDPAGHTNSKTFTLTVDPPRPLTISNQSDQLSPGTVGQSYAIGVFPDGGVGPYRWSLVAGALPPGLSLTASPGRITGTPTRAGTFTFTLRVTDSRGSTAQRQFSITVS